MGTVCIFVPAKEGRKHYFTVKNSCIFGMYVFLCLLVQCLKRPGERVGAGITGMRAANVSGRDPTQVLWKNKKSS